MILDVMVKGSLQRRMARNQCFSPAKHPKYVMSDQSTRADSGCEDEGGAV